MATSTDRAEWFAQDVADRACGLASFLSVGEELPEDLAARVLASLSRIDVELVQLAKVVTLARAAKKEKPERGGPSEAMVGELVATPTRVRTTPVTLHGKCDYALEGVCIANPEGSLSVHVVLDDNRQLNVCIRCFNELITTRQWGTDEDMRWRG